MFKKLNLGKRRAALIVSVVIVVGLAGWIIVKNNTTQLSYKTAEVTLGNIENLISSSGKVQPKDYVDVGAQVSGQLDAFLVDVGDQVEKGQLLAQIDETLAATQVEADRAQLKELQASFAEQEAVLELSTANAARADMLYKADAISQVEFQAAMADDKIAAARLTQLEAQIERQNSTLEADLATLEFTKIFAPMAGTVVSQSAVEGQTLNANQTTPTILRIADLSVMTVEAEVSEADVLRVKHRQEAYFQTLGGGDQKWQTTVRQILPQPEILNDVVLYTVLLDVANDDGELLPEMTAQVFFVAGAAKNVVLAPVAALREPRQARGNAEILSEERMGDTEGSGGLIATQAQETRPPERENPNRAAMREAIAANPEAERKMVLVMTDDGPRPRPVLVGLQNRVFAEIVYGLQPGEVVVTSELQARLPVERANDDNRTSRPPGIGPRGPR